MGRNSTCTHLASKPLSQAALIHGYSAELWIEHVEPIVFHFIRSVEVGIMPSDEKKTDAAQQTARPRDPIDPSHAHVLVVEDNVPNFVLVMRMLAYMGVHCEWKTSGWQVAEFADTLARIDLILLDIRLPYEDGFEAIKKLRANPRIKDTLIVAVTAEASPEQMRRAKESGFDGFIGKPLDPDRFPEQIRRILSGEPVWEWK